MTHSFKLATSSQKFLGVFQTEHSTRFLVLITCSNAHQTREIGVSTC
jgi:hypothetical protein